MTKMMWAAVCVGIVVGGVAAFFLLKKLRGNREETNTEDDVSALVKNQLVCDALRMPDVVGWFRDNAAKAKGEAVFFLAKPTKHTAEMFAIIGDIELLDAEHNLLQAVVDSKKNLPVAIRLIAFDTCPDKLTEQLNGKDYMIITNN